MTVKVRPINGLLYFVVHHRGKRFFKRAPDDPEKAESDRQKLETYLDMEGIEALQERFGRKKSRKIPKIKTYGANWVAELEKTNLKPSTIHRYAYDIDRYVIPAFGHLEIDQITYAQLKRFVIEKVDAGLSRDTVRNIVASIRGMMNEALEEGWIDANPVQRLGKFWRKGKVRREEPEPFTYDELAAVIEKAQEKRYWYELILVLARTGMRPGEGIALKWEDLDFPNGLIQVRRNLPSHPGVREVGKPKTIAGRRDVDMPEELAIALRALKTARKAAWLKKGRAEIPDWIFCTRDGELHRYGNLRRAWLLICEKAKVRYRSPGQLRHTWASHRLSEGKPLLWVSKQLGHSDANITLRTYARWMPEQERVLARNLRETGQKEG